MEEELQKSKKNCVGVPFKSGFDERRNYDGRPPDTFQDKIIKKATKELIAEYKEGLGQALPLIKPIIIAKALEGDMTAIKEIHDRVMDKAKQPMEQDIFVKELPKPILDVIPENHSELDEN